MMATLSMSAFSVRAHARSTLNAGARNPVKATMTTRAPRLPATRARGASGPTPPPPRRKPRRPAQTLL